MTMKVALVHDYLTQRGGAERVVLSMLKAFPEAPLYTSLYNPDTTFPAFRDADIRALPVNRIAPLRRRHRAALPLLAPAFSRLQVSADILICSSSGWAHGARTSGRKIVYCYTPARWLYQADRYLGEKNAIPRAGLAVIKPYLQKWDRAAASTADDYLAISTVVKDRIRQAYGIEADLLPPPQTLDPEGPQIRPAGLPERFFLSVSRLLPYKNLHALQQALVELPSKSLVLAGSGPEMERLSAAAPSNVHMLGAVSDAQLRWLYSHCTGLVAPSYEDLGLTTLEAAAFGKPSAALRWGGFLDTVKENVTGVFFDRPEPSYIARALRSLSTSHFDPHRIMAHAAEFAEPAFIEKLRAVALSPRPQ